MNHIDTMKLALEAMGLIGADLVCEAAHHEKADRHGIGEPCPIQARWHHAFTALREALAEQPAQKCSYPYCGCNSKAWCKVERNEALDKKAENARELGLDYEPAQQEPVAKHYVDGGHLVYPPAQRTWVGLQDDEIYSVFENLQVMHHRPPTTDSRVIFARAIEAKLREKNT